MTENAAKIAFDMRDPLSADGEGESALVQLNGIIRKPGAASIIVLSLSGTPGTDIPAGSMVGTADAKTIFATMEAAVIAADGTAIVRAACLDKGSVNPDLGTVAAIMTPISGWSGVTNTGTESIGSAEETDEELRRRQQQSTNATSYRQIEAIRASILNVPGVTFCRAYQNSGLTTDERGIPGKTLACVVAGGDNYEIARAIAYRTPLGIGYQGSVQVLFQDAQGMAEVVSFSRPIERPVSVVVNLQVVVDENIQLFPSNGIALIKQAVLDFAATGHTPCEPLGNTGFPPGQDIVRSYLYTPINSIGGAKIVSVLLGVGGSTPADVDSVAIAWNEQGTFAADRITVNIVD